MPANQSASTVKAKPSKEAAVKLAGLERVLGVRFKDRALLEKAVTHSSVKSNDAARADNERLEFLGDRVLGLAIAEELWRAFPTSREGELARRFNRLVRRETCADIARQIDLGPYLVLSDSEAVSGGRDKDTILADALEAILGAVFTDGGWDKARRVVLHLWGDRTGSAPVVEADPKSALQEWAQGRGLPLPKYVEVARSGPDHAPNFVSEVRIRGCDPARGEGPSKRHAEQAAAEAMLARETGARSNFLDR